MKRWPIKCAVSMHLHALKAECIISQCKYQHLTVRSRISILNSMALTMKCRTRSQHPNRPPNTRWAHWVSSAGGSQKHPKSSHTNMELKILRISLLQNMPPQHSHINQINIHLSAFQTDMGFYAAIPENGPRHGLVCELAPIFPCSVTPANSSL